MVSMINTEFEYTLNTLNASDKRVLFEMYSLTKMKSATNGEGKPKTLYTYTDDYRKREGRESFRILMKLHNEGIVRISEHTKPEIKEHCIAFSENSIANFETLEKWLETPSFNVLQTKSERASALVVDAKKNAAEARDAVLQRIKAFYPYVEIKNFTVAEIDATSCKLNINNIDTVIPLAVLNSSDPYAAYAEMQRRHTAGSEAVKAKRSTGPK
jgi:hypothetical protein